MQFKKLIQKRKSVRKFLIGKKANWKKILRALDTVRMIPSAGNQYNLKFILVSKEEIISQIGEACQQDFIKNASHVLVCVSDESILERLYGERGRRYTAQTAGAAIQNLLLALTEEGISTTWIGFFYDEMIKSLLNIPDELVVEAVFPLGLEAKNNTKKTQKKTDLENILFFDEWGNKEMEPLPRVTEDTI